MEYMYWDHKPFMFQTNCYKYNTEKIMKKPNYLSTDSVESTNDYPSILTTKTCSNVNSSILSYIVGGFVGSKSQMNSNKSHNLSYDLSAAISNLLNPWRYENEKQNASHVKTNSSQFCRTPTKIPQYYDKYVLNSHYQTNDKEEDCVVNVVDIECLIAVPINDFGDNKDCVPHVKTNNSTSELVKLKSNISNSKICDRNQDFSQKSNMGIGCATKFLATAQSRLIQESDKNLGKTSTYSASDTLQNENLEGFNKNQPPNHTKSTMDIDYGAAQCKHSSNYFATERFRQQSECSVESTDSESFIVFEDHTDNDSDICKEKSTCYSDIRNCTSDEYDESEEDEDENEYYCVDSDECCENNSSSDEYDFCSVNKSVLLANDRWMKNYCDVNVNRDESFQKVKFNDNVKLNKIVAWDHAYRRARIGPWEQMARDRFRFQGRISRLSAIISPVLSLEHRNKIYKHLHS
ncbi:hypothetical protein RUM44_004295 [Polyplax serrata]|uniref:Protein DP71L n=1 Tax=Polyplax serrata TaxID=468196 RepID=A0ABR1B2T9_POLSC